MFRTAAGPYYFIANIEAPAAFGKYATDCKQDTELNIRNFPAHGELALEIEGRLLRIKGEGPANVEAIINYQRDVQQYRQQLAHSPWASLVELSGQPMLPPEATSMMIDTIKFAKTMNLVATAVVFVDVEFAESVKQFWQAIYQKAKLKHAFFNTTDDAKDWLIDQIENS